MIILEFRDQALFSLASEDLKRHKVNCISEASMVTFRSSYIFLFEEQVRTAPQHRALERARRLEAEGRSRMCFTDLPNLAIPL
jgi:hypothetical protein